ncbi:MAG: TetR/AcrR family transcriptional regulator [Treponema sp.]|nr:TetR/AcrR family transcriptional regulator [Treponema sp.]
MQNEKETKEKLMKSAKAEFMEKGYMSASLRTICKKAGVTTGALYFFFKDKEDLFASLVQEPLDKMMKIITDHYESETDHIFEHIKDSDSENIEFADDFVASSKAIKLLYSYYDEMILLIAKSQGSRFENSMDKFVSITEKHYTKISEIICTNKNMPNMDANVIHWISHVHIEAFAYLLTHVKSEDEAEKILPHIIKYLTGGWYRLYDFF